MTTKVANASVPTWTSSWFTSCPNCTVEYKSYLINSCPVSAMKLDVQLVTLLSESWIQLNKIRCPWHTLKLTESFFGTFERERKRKLCSFRATEQILLEGISLWSAMQLVQSVSNGHKVSIGQSVDNHEQRSTWLAFKCTNQVYCNCSILV